MNPRPTICMHLHANDDLSHVEKLANYAKELGAEYVRLDIWWNEIMPEPGKISIENMIKWGEIIGKLRNKDLEIIAILGTGYGSFIHRYPDWVVVQIDKYFLCLETCSPGPLVEKPPKANSTLRYNIPNELEEKIKKSYIESLKHISIDNYMNKLEQVREEYPAWYNKLNYDKLKISTSVERPYLNK